MQLKKITIEGFKNIEKITLSFENIVSLISLNNYGKSNVLEGINFIFKFIRASDELRDEMMGWYKGIPLNIKNDYQNFIVNFCFYEDSLQEKYSNIIDYGFEFIWDKNDNSGKKIVKEWLRLKKDKKNHRFYNVIKRVNNECFYKASVNGRCDKYFNIKDNQLALDLLLKKDNLYYYPIINKILNTRVYIDKNLNFNNTFKDNYFILKTVKKFDLVDDCNIPRVVYNLKKEYEKEYDLLIDSFCNLFPNITNIVVKENITDTFKDLEMPDDIPYTITNKMYTIYVKDKNLNQALNIDQLSDGTKRIFFLLTHLVLAKMNNISLIGLEEPENCIHPKLLQQLIILMDRLSGDCKIIISSHSPYILDCVETSNIYVGKPNDYGLADFSKINNRKINSLYRDAEKYSSSVGQYLFELLSGDELDLEMLFDYLEN